MSTDINNNEVIGEEEKENNNEEISLLDFLESQENFLSGRQPIGADKDGFYTD